MMKYYRPHSGKGYSRDDDHLALFQELLGRMPKKLALSGKYSKEYFDAKGIMKNVRRMEPWNLHDVLVQKYLWESEEALRFSEFLLPMLRFDKSKRASAAECQAPMAIIDE